MFDQISFGGSMAWERSPAPGVQRKRLFHSGGAESGTVTSLVQYAAGSRFPDHGHPGGEEMLVLAGTLSDERGDFSPGTYLLNPEGFRHTPYSREGCTVFVKLRQYEGSRRERIYLDTTKSEWKSAALWTPPTSGSLRAQTLYRSLRYPERTQLLELSPGTRFAPLGLPQGEELFVISGQLEDEHGVYPEHTWLTLPPGNQHSPSSANGAVLYVRQGGFAMDRPLAAAAASRH
ncbi:MAG: hypothetical protein RL033_4859 [Pseudomonadota bacterium]